jgi:ribonuclease P protein subunit RPR2
MAKKKSQDDVPNPSSVQNRDIMQRLNYLYQASVLLGSTTALDNSRSQPSRDWSCPSRRQIRERELPKKRHPSTMLDLSRTYVRSMKVIGTKTTVRMLGFSLLCLLYRSKPSIYRDPSVKRTLCKKCAIVLVPGTTALVRVNCKYNV